MPSKPPRAHCPTDDFLAQYALRVGLDRDVAEAALGELLVRYHQAQSARSRSPRPSEPAEAPESFSGARASN